MNQLLKKVNKSLEKNIQRIKRFSLTCTLNDNGHVRHFHCGHEYVEIGGIKWATCNVGAEKPTDSGLYFAWGETQGFTAEQVRNHERWFNWDNYKYGTYDYLTKYNDTDKKIVLELQDDAATINMGIGWRMPTRDELKVLIDSTTCKWATDYQGSGVNGMLFTDKTDNSKVLFFPAAGNCNYSSVFSVGSYGRYWSSSLYAGYLEYGFELYFIDEGADWGNVGMRFCGFAVRGVVG